MLSSKQTILDGSLAAGDVALAEGSILRGNSSGVAAAHSAKTSGQILVGDGTTVASVAVSGDATLASTGALTIAADAVSEAEVADSSGAAAGGFHVAKFVQVKYDFATHGGGAPGAITLSNGPTVPDNAIVLLHSYDVETTCTSAGDTATIKIGLATDGDLSTAIAINDASNPWDAGPLAASAVTPIIRKTTGARQFVLTSATQALTAGKINFNFIYWIGA